MARDTYHERMLYTQSWDEPTSSIPDDAVRHLTCFDQELIRGLEARGFQPFPVHGRALAHGSDGALYLVSSSAEDGLLLSSTVSPQPRSDCWADLVVLVGVAEDGVLGRSHGMPAGAGLVIAPDGRAALAWHDDDGVRLACGTAAAGEMVWDAPVLLAEGARLGDLAFAADGILHVLYDTADGLFHAERAGSTWETTYLAEHGSTAVLAIGGNGDLHVAYQYIITYPWQVGEAHGEAIDESIRYRRRVGGVWTPDEAVTWPITFHPSLVLWHDTPLIVFQTEGIRRVEPLSPEYLQQREGGGSGVGFAFREADGRWRIGTVARPEEIVIADRRGHDVFSARVYPAVEEMHRPQLGLDRHGVPWVVWANTTRRHTYAARWLGDGFSAPLEVRGGWYALAPGGVTVAKANAGPLVMATLAADRVYHTPVVVPTLRASSPARVLFLDLLELVEMAGLEQELGRFTRYAGNPVFTPDRPGTWDDQVVAWPSVWREGDRYLMQYQAKGTLLPNANVIMGLAESPDGIHWTRPNLGVVPLEGQPENNCIPWVIFFRDEEEPDPAKRYKGARTDGLWTVDLARTAMTSPDAVHWTEAGEMTGMTCLFEANGPSFRDPYDVPARRFKAIGRTAGDEGRDAGMMWSADGLHWEGYEAFLDVDDPYGQPAATWRGRYMAHRYLHGCGERRGQGQIYWNTVWIEHGLYICLYAPMHWDGGYDAALAVSRDGYQWTRVCGGAPLLEREPVGMRESGVVLVGYGNNRPVRVGDRLRLYYSSIVRHHGTEPHATCTGSGISFAEMRADGWVSLRLQRDRETGFCTTIPIDVSDGRYQLYLDAEGLDRDRTALAVEVLDAQTGCVLPGFSAADCRVEDDLTVTWHGGALGGSAPVRLRLLVSSPYVKLYGFWFRDIGMETP